MTPGRRQKEFLDKYDVHEISLPESWQEAYPYKDEMGNGPDLRDEALAPFPRTAYATKKHIQEYYAIITHLDEQIGQILTALENKGKMDNTYIIFTADHGTSHGQAWLDRQAKSL